MFHQATIPEIGACFSTQAPGTLEQSHPPAAQCQFMRKDDTGETSTNHKDRRRVCCGHFSSIMDNTTGDLSKNKTRELRSLRVSAGSETFAERELLTWITQIVWMNTDL